MKYIALNNENLDQINNSPGVLVFDIETGEEILSVPHNNSGVPDIAFSPDDRFLAVAWGGGSKHGLEIWDIQKKEMIKTYTPATHSFLNFSKNSNLIISGNNGFIILYKTPWYTSVLNKNVFKALISYPNPTKSIINIEFDLLKPDITIIEISDLKGRVMKILLNQFLIEGKHSLFFDLSDLASGAYMLRLQSGNSVFSKKILINK